MLRLLIRRIALLTPLALLAACAYAPGDMSSPLARKATWFSFVAGDDLRTTCHAGAPDRFRIVYNGVWDEQVRIYEIGFAGPHQLDERVIGPGQIDEISISHPLAPWAGTTRSITLNAEETARLTRDLERSGAYRTPGASLTVKADDFYWIAASCHDGTFHLTAWLYPSDEFSHLSFATWLMALDTTGVPLNQPRSWTEVANGSTGIAGNPPRTVLPQRNWAFGIANDQLVDRIEF